MVQIVAFLVGILGNIIAAEIYQNAPAIALWILRQAAGRLPEQQRLVVLDTWTAEQTAIVGHIGKLAHAISCFFGVIAARARLDARQYTRTSTESCTSRPRGTAGSFLPVLTVLFLVVWSASSLLLIWDGLKGLVNNGFEAFILSVLITAQLLFFSWLAAAVSVNTFIKKERPKASRPFTIIRWAVLLVMVAPVLFVSIVFSYATYFKMFTDASHIDQSRPFSQILHSLEEFDNISWIALAFALASNFLVFFLALSFQLWSRRLPAPRRGLSDPGV